MQKSRVIRAYISIWHFLVSLLFRAGLIVLIAYLIYHHDENPPVISVLVLFCFILFIYSGNDEIIIYSDKIVQKNTALIGGLFFRKNKVYNFNEIKAVSTPERSIPDPAGLAIIALLILLLPSKSRQNRDNRIYIEFKNGETVTMSSEFSQETLDEIAVLINEILNGQN